jgi:hypothetical protein
LIDGAWLHAFISAAPAPPNPDIDISIAGDPEARIGFDRFLNNGSYTDLEVHAMRLHFHSVMMRSGVEKTNETADNLL